jgi:hypothetical protein
MRRMHRQWQPAMLWSFVLHAPDRITEASRAMFPRNIIVNPRRGGISARLGRGET